MYKYLFGPVPSRRLGMSLGIDLVPHKVCTLNCVYCECGKTTDLTTERKEYVPYKKVIEELEHFMNNNPAPDYITFSGSGEPTLNSRIGDIVEFIKQNYPKISLALLTNGTLLNDKKVRAEILKTDVVLPSLDAASKKAYLKINRPFHSLDLTEYIKGLVEFRKEYNGKIWLEVLIIPDYNDDKENLKLLKEAFLKIKPESIQLNSLDRPGVIDSLRTISRQELQEIANFWNLDNVEIIASAPERKDIKSYRSDTESAILETIFRRPCTLDDLTEILGMHRNELNKYLDVLDAEKKIEMIRQERGVFYQTKKTN
ncbi:MAG: radical SAM protein [Bacteroidota bacterium]|nr:radical SAM protein [Bacteroidota bacterium]